MRSKEIKKILGYFSILLLFIVFVGYLFIGAKFTTIFLILANLFQILSIINEEKIVIRSKKFVLLCFLIFIPSLYNNAYIEDGLYYIIIYYVLIINFSILFSQNSNAEKYIEFFMNLSIIFAILTSLVSWYSYFNPSIYINLFIKRLPQSVQIDAYKEFVLYGNRMGLTTHYSRNAFYIIVGILGLIQKITNKKRKIDIIFLVFLLITMLLIGKRGHIIFFALACFLSYIIYNKISLKNSLKLVLGILLILIIVYLAIKFVPGASYTYTRFSQRDLDISNGRFDMYSDAIELYKNNNDFPIGWGQYARSTNYIHPALHNDYLQILIENGVIGFIFIIFSNLYILKINIERVKKTKNSYILICLIYNIFYLLYSFTGLPHYDVETYLLYFIINAMMFSLITEKKEKI